MIKGKERIIVVSLLLFCFMGSQVTAQSKEGIVAMSLDACLTYAKEHNIALKKSKLQEESKTVDVKTARAAFLPSLAASVGQNLVNNPYGSDYNKDKNTYNASYGVNASVTLYNGGKTTAQLRQSKLNTEIAGLESDIITSNLELDITNAYIQILYAKENVEVLKNAVELSRKNLERGNSLLEAGSINKVDLAQLQTAEATEQYNLISAETALNELYLQLKQLLEIDKAITFQVEVPELSEANLAAPIPSLEQVYSTALESRPEVKADSLNIDASEISVKIAKADYKPSVNLNASMGTNHGSGRSDAFSDQVKSAWNNNVGISLNIPISSNRRVKSAVTKSKLAVQTAELNLQETEKTLYKTIESLHNNAVNAQAKFDVAKYKMDAVEKSLDLTTQQYELGMKNIIELLTEQDTYRKSSQEYLQNKYLLIMNKAFLAYYETGIMKID